MSNVTWSYDEERELTRYLWENYAEFFSPQERHLAQVIAARQVAESRTSSNRTIIPSDYPGTYYSDPAINHTLLPGAYAVQQQAALRVMLQRQSDIRISRCPRCQRILRRVTALQCFWCGLDWHDGRM
jgi:uncharacterized protein with PIN domain